MEKERVYLNRRAGEERQAATKAADSRARDAHIAMAEQYEARLRGTPNGAASVPEPVAP